MTATGAINPGFSIYTRNLGAVRDTPENDEGKPKKVEFTPEQQERVNELIREKMGEAGRGVRAELDQTKAQLTDLQAKLTEATDALKAAKTPAEKKEAKGDIDQLRSEINELKSVHASVASQLEQARNQIVAKDKEVLAAREETLNVRKSVVMQTAIGKVGFIDPGIVAEVTAKFIKYDGERKRFVVLNEEGGERVDASFAPMSLDDFYQDYAARNPFLVRGDARGGAGSAPSQGLSNNGKYTVEMLFGPKGDGDLANKVAREDPATYRKLRAVAKERNLVA